MAHRGSGLGREARMSCFAQRYAQATTGSEEKADIDHAEDIIILSVVWENTKLALREDRHASDRVSYGKMARIRRKADDPHPIGS
nr:hypothetical protein CFP56_32359 [Quercus suber]